jgi:hypothetical protein
MVLGLVTGSGRDELLLIRTFSLESRLDEEQRMSGT